MAQVIVTKRGMGAVEGGFHVFMCVMTCGLWYPVYRLRKHQADRTSTTTLSA